MTLYQIIRNRIETTGALNWVDKDRGQIDGAEKASGPFPMALIKISITSTESLGGGIQQCTGTVTVRVAHDIFIETTSKASEAAQERSTTIDDIAQEVYVSLQDYTELGITSLDRTSFGDEDNKHKLSVIKTVFKVIWTDASASGCNGE